MKTEELWALYESGKTCKEVGDAAGVTASAVARRLKKAGYTLRSAYGDAQRDEVLVDEVVRLYTEELLSTADIGRIIGKNANVVTKYLKRRGVTIDPRGRTGTAEKLATANSGRAIVETRICDCGEAFSAAVNATKKYCSQSCAADALRSERSPCPCGVMPPSRSARYCSDECRAKYTPKLQKNPANWVVFNCEVCDDEVERPKAANRAYRFCSNKCAKTRGWFSGRPTTFDSRTEFRYAAYLEVTGQDWRFYDSEDLETPVGVYRPDFIVAQWDTEQIVEVKGRVTEESAAKIEWALANVPNFTVLYEEDVERLFASLTGADASLPH